MKRKQLFEVDIVHPPDFRNQHCLRRIFAKIGHPDQFVLRPHKEHHLGDGRRDGDDTLWGRIQLHMPVVGILPREESLL